MLLLEAAGVFLGEGVSGVRCSVACTYCRNLLPCVSVEVDVVVEAPVFYLGGVGSGTMIM